MTLKITSHAKEKDAAKKSHDDALANARAYDKQDATQPRDLAQTRQNKRLGLS